MLVAVKFDRVMTAFAQGRRVQAQKVEFLDLVAPQFVSKQPPGKFQNHLQIIYEFLIAQLVTDPLGCDDAGGQSVESAPPNNARVVFVNQLAALEVGEGFRFVVESAAVGAEEKLFRLLPRAGRPPGIGVAEIPPGGRAWAFFDRPAGLRAARGPVVSFAAGSAQVVFPGPVIENQFHPPHIEIFHGRGGNHGPPGHGYGFGVAVFQGHSEI